MIYVGKLIFKHSLAHEYEWVHVYCNYWCVYVMWCNAMQCNTMASKVMQAMFVFYAMYAMYVVYVMYVMCVMYVMYLGIEVRVVMWSDVMWRTATQCNAMQCNAM